MWSKAGVLGGTGSFNPGIWTMAGLGITIAFCSCRKWVDHCVRKLRVFAQEENDNAIDRLPDDILCLYEENDNAIDRLPDYILCLYEENDNAINRLPDDILCLYEENDNAIKRLPDDILCNIVSRLKSIEASQTSILSKRWRKIWSMNPRLIFTCLRTLDISEEHHDHVVADVDKQRFFKAVNECLHLYSGRKLKSLFLQCCFLDGHTCHLVQWMQTLARLDIEELYLINSCRTEPHVKAFTFSFKVIHGLSGLRILDLMSCNLETTFVGECNSLVTLSLRHIPSLLWKGLFNILSSCPNLKSLYLEHCGLPMDLRIRGPNHKLETLKLMECSCVKKLEITDCNLVKIIIDIRSEVEILLSCLPKLKELRLKTPGMNHCFGDAQTDLPQLKHLLVQANYQIKRFPPKFEVFGNIMTLCIISRGHPYLGASAYEEVDLWNFVPVLGACPLLQKFYLKVEGPYFEEAKRKVEWPVLQHKNLKYLQLTRFSDTQNEVEFAKFILKSVPLFQYLSLMLSSSTIYYQNQKHFELLRTALQSHAISMPAKVDFDYF